MRLKFPDQVVIASHTYKVILDPEEGGGSFDSAKSILVIGTKYLKSDPNYTFNVICHEISEMCHVILCHRYSDHSVHGNYKFFMDHKEFQNHTALFAQTIQQFIK
jgi:hypothetical protein